jgi:hypothetical protein
MICINFSHPLTSEQLHQIESLCGVPFERLVDVTCHIDEIKAIGPQISALADSTGLSLAQWQTFALIVIPPALHIAAVALMAELHGRIGHFPSVVRFRAIENNMAVRFEAAEIVNLQALRLRARGLRKKRAM